MLTRDAALNQFFQAWTQEFARATAAPFREYPTVSCGRARHLVAVDVSGFLWWRATLEGSQGFPLWVGAHEKTWSAAGKLNWIRLLERVQITTVETVNPELAYPVRAGRAQLVQEPPEKEGLCYAVMGIKLARTELPALLFAIDPLAREELILGEAALSNIRIPERLLDLELPLSVALGRTQLPIGEILKITSGSVIHLHGSTGAEVEVVVHGTVVARGHVVSQKGNYGVRIHQIISTGERLKLCAED